MTEREGPDMADNEAVAPSAGWPDFIIIGAAKCATTSIADFLDSREDVFLTSPKEPEFFARDDRYALGPGPYLALFAGAAPGQIRGEASTIYSLAPHFPQTAARMARHCPAARLVYVIREPVGRAYAFYAQLVKNRQRQTGDMRVHRSFEDSLFPGPGVAPRDLFFGRFDTHYPDDPGVFLDGSDYLRQIRAYLDHFPREQILCLALEDLVRDPRAGLSRLLAHIGARPLAEGEPVDLPESNRASDFYDQAVQEQFIRDIAGRTPGLARRIARMLPAEARAAIGARLFRRLGKGKAAPQELMPPLMTEATRRLLADRFGADRAELSALTGLDLDRLWGPADEAGRKVTQRD